MSREVKVTADDNGLVVIPSKNSPESGYIRVVQTVPLFQRSGFVKQNQRSALIKGKVSELKAMGLKAGQVLPGKIVVVESFEAPNKENDMQDLKVAGATGVVCRVDDQPIYRTAFYTEDLEEKDVYIQHTNVEEIREAQLQLKEEQANLSE